MPAECPLRNDPLYDGQRLAILVKSVPIFRQIHLPIYCLTKEAYMNWRESEVFNKNHSKENKMVVCDNIG